MSALNRNEIHLSQETCVNSYFPSISVTYYKTHW